MSKYALVLLGAVLLAGCSESLLETESVAVESEAAASLAATNNVVAKSGSAVYEVTIENLTSGQPITPPLIATHRAAASFFEVGSAASFGLKEIAENGNLAPMHEALETNKHVYETVIAVDGTPPPVLPGDDVTIQINAEKGAKFLSYASMLICTNDGFTGVNGLRLPKQVGDVTVVESDGYDAGTEINTEDFADIVPPCQALVGVSSGDPGTGTSNPGLAENGVITHHPNIQGGNDLLVGTHGWSDPVARITVERVQ